MFQNKGKTGKRMEFYGKEGAFSGKTFRNKKIAFNNFNQLCLIKGSPTFGTKKMKKA